MALLPPNIYHRMQETFRRYEEGTLKGQKERVMEGIILQKALEGKLAPKLYQFKVFQGLKVTNLSLFDLKYYAVTYRVMTKCDC